MTPTTKFAFIECSDIGELESLLSKQAPLEAYIEWLDSVVDRCVIKVNKVFSVKARNISVKIEWVMVNYSYDE